ncbi:MAG: hypothetical protein ACK56F_11285, partial [bacterium]
MQRYRPQKIVNSRQAPRFWSRPIFFVFLAWSAGTTRLGQCRRQSAHLSWPAGRSWHSASTRGGDNTFRRRTPARSSRCLYFIDAYICCRLYFHQRLSFTWCLYF